MLKNLDTALRKFLNDWSSFNDPEKPDRYSTSQDLFQYFREVTPDSLQYVIIDLSEEVNNPM